MHGQVPVWQPVRAVKFKPVPLLLPQPPRTTAASPVTGRAPVFKSGPAWKNWKWQVSNILSSPEQLASLTGKKKLPDSICRVLEKYPWSATPYYLSLIDWNDHNDPIKRQCFPSSDEVEFSLAGSDPDPLAEAHHSPCRGMIHRYRDRVLVMATGRCFTYCRHCNRKRNWKHGTPVPSRTDIEQMSKYISARPFIREVIISGGDPLTLSVETLDRMLYAFRKIDNIEVLRLGTRVPVVLPMRITRELTAMIESHRPLWVNTHFNHPRELTEEAAAACDMLLTAGIPVSNHAVLLRGVNDSFEILRTLFTGLNRIMVRPYYLFHCDAARGTDHFRTSINTGIGIMQKLWGETGGLCIPRYVVDLPSGGGKAPVMPSFLLQSDGDTAVFRTSEGKIMKYSGALGAEGYE